MNDEAPDVIRVGLERGNLLSSVVIEDAELEVIRAWGSKGVEWEGQ